MEEVDAVDRNLPTLVTVEKRALLTAVMDERLSHHSAAQTSVSPTQWVVSVFEDTAFVCQENYTPLSFHSCGASHASHIQYG